MFYRWKTQGKANNLQDILRYIAKERNFNKDQILKFLSKKQEQYDPFLFKNMDIIVKKIKRHIGLCNKIMIVGDYDCDGVTASYILYRALKELEADVEIKLPHRLYDGYGLKPKLINYANSKGCKLIITVDNGITAIDSVELANKLGIDIIITDHHQPQEKLPNCLFLDAHVNGSNYPFNGLCGAGVAFKLATALIKDFKNSKIYEDLLQCCAIATVADAMEIIDENRTFVIDGLKLLNKTNKKIGIGKLLELMEMGDREIKVDTIGFTIGPCINAAGRLDSPNKALDLLLCDDEVSSEKCAKKLVDLNNKRKELQKKVTDELLFNENNSCLIAEVDPNIAGICGIIASNIVDKYQKPSFVIHGKDVLTGSGRSVGEFPIIECLTKNKQLINNGGGHKAACGFSINRDKLKDFQDSCNKIYNNWLIENPELKNPVLKSTCELNFDLVSKRLYNNIVKLQPFGNGNEEPIFITKNVKILSYKIVGKFENAIQFNFNQNFIDLKGIGFDQIKCKYIELGCPENIDLMYKISINEWPAGEFNIQLFIVDLHKI